MHKRTFRLDRLSHKFLKPKGIAFEHLAELASELEKEGFIKILQDRYMNTDKMLERRHVKELFKIVQKVGEK